MNAGIAAGLDLGTSKICAVIVEMAPAGTARVLGVGHCPSQGLRRGVVTDVEKTVQAIERAARQAELMAGVEMSQVCAGIAGEHVSGLNSSGVVAVAAADGRIGEGDRQRVLEAAAAVKIPIDREILHVLPQEFVVDGRRDIADPVGMFGVRLEAHVHVVTGAVTAAQNICRSILRAGLEVGDIALEPLASSCAILEEDERQMGVGLIDIGGGTTDIALFARGGLRYTGALGLGGQNVTSDVAIGLRTSWSQAERIKCAWGTAAPAAVGADEVVEVEGIAGRPPRQVSRRLLADIVEARMEEIFALVREKLEPMRGELAAGLVLTGGGALVEGAVALAERVFGLPVRLGVPRALTGMVEGLDHPACATALGLARLAAAGPRRAGAARLERENMAGFEAVFNRMKEWFQTWV